MACDNESSPSVKVILDCYAKLLSEKFASKPFFKQDKSHQQHPSEFFPLDEFCDALEKFPETGLEFVKKLCLITHHNSAVQLGVSRWDMDEEGEMIVEGSRARVPDYYWHDKLDRKAKKFRKARTGLAEEQNCEDRKLIQKGNPVTAKLVPIKVRASET